MGASRSHKDLIAWQKALDLAARVHDETSRFPRFEQFGLAAQMRRASVSIVSNIAEGTARRTTREFVAFLHFARGSLAELETQMLLAVRVGYVAAIKNDELQPAVDEVGRLINGVLRGLRTRAARERAQEAVTEADAGGVSRAGH
jgi:four helix bundle protein